MDQQINELHALGSPRNPLDLTEELGDTKQGEGSNHFQFEDGQNPFSYYHQENNRDMNSSQDENNQHNNKSIDLSSNNQEKNSNAMSLNDQKYTQVEIGDNIASKPAIALALSPKVVKPVQSTIINSPQKLGNLKYLKQEEFDLSKISSLGSNITSPTKQKGAKTDRDYKRQLDNEMEQLKNNFKGKDNKKKSKIFGAFKQEKPAQKINLNKTYAPTPRTKSNIDNESQIQQIRMLIKIAFEKKKANYEMLKVWDRKRAQTMALHGRMIELLQNQVDLRIKSSLQNFEYYQTFFRQKAKQQQKYGTSTVINTRFALQNNSLSKNVYINCSVILNSLCDQNTNRCRKINDFVQLIRTNILKELTENHLNSSQKELLKIRQKISTLKSSLKRYNIQTEQKTIELASLFGQQSSNITNRLDKDFYRTQLSFLRKALQQIQVQKTLGQYCLQYYHTAMQQEYKRSQVIREAMVTYSRGLKETYNLSLQCAELQQMSKHEQIKLIQQFYSLQEMFDIRTLQLFKQRNNIKLEDELKVDFFTNYIHKFNYQIFDSRIILLKEFNVKYITGKNKQITEQTCYLVITVDNFLHLFFQGSRGLYNKPDITIKISHKCLQVKVGKDEFVDVVKREQKRNSMMSYFWDNKIEKVYRIKFSKKDNKQEFLDYVTKLMVDNY